MAAANLGGFRLVRCPKCFNVLPEPPNVSVYQCGGCNTTLRAKIRVSNGQNVATKQVRQDSDNYSVTTSVNNGVPPQNKDLVFSSAATDSSCTPDAPSTETENDGNGTRSNEKGDVMSAEKNAMEVEHTENKEDCNFDCQNTNAGMESPADLVHPNANGTHIDSDRAENNTTERSAENSEACRVREDGDMKRSLDASEHHMPPSKGSKVAGNLPESEQKGATETEPAANKKSYLVRVQSRSCDLQEGPRSSVNSLDFHSARTSLQSKSFRASEPLQSKILKTVDELRGDLSELFTKPSDFKPRPYPPRPSKQEGYMSRVAITSSVPLTAYHPTAKHSVHAVRLSRSGQVAPHGLPSPQYHRCRAYPCFHNGQMEMRPCPHECCHGCRPLCYRSWKQEPAPQKPSVKEIKRRPPPRHHCRPVLRGAPFVVCSNCLRLVQLPTDFTVPSKATRRLQCGSCSELLSYSYRDPSRKKLESSFGDEYSTDGYDIHQIADDHNNGFHQADPVSYSEEYGLSFGVSYSTEDEQPLYVSRNSSFNTDDERNAKESKLHRLMGYSSASELLRHSPDLYESFDKRTPNARSYDRKGKGICMADDDSGEDDNSAMKRSKVRGVGLPLQGILKKGIHGLESLKLKS